MRAGTWFVNRDIGAARANWQHARRIADRLPVDERDLMTMRIAPRSLLCGSAWRAGGSVADTGFDELRQLCTDSDSQIPLLMGMAGLMSSLSVHARIRESAELAPEYVARIDSLGDRTLTVALLFAAIYAECLAGRMRTSKRLAQRVIDLADGDATMGNVLTGSPLAFATVMRAIARCCLGEDGWRADFDDANRIAHQVDPTTFVSTVMFKYVTGIALGALVPDANALAETSDALDIAQRYSEDMALGLAQLARGMTLIHSDQGSRRSEGFSGVPQLNTVRGEIDTADLGVTLMHEHVFVLSPEINDNHPEVIGDEAKRESDAIERLNELKSRGVDSIVDLTVIGLGRYIPRIARIAAATDVNIVVATGIYTYNDVPMYFHFRGPGTLLDGPEIMTDMFVSDITEGIAGTGIKAAILKCATDEPGVTPGVERVLRAVAQAHRQTGVPISTHTHAATRRGLEQQRIFTEEGVDLSRVVIGHSGDSTDIDYLEELIGNGSYIGMDRFGLDTFLNTEQRVNTVATMCERGHADKMVLSHDAACFNDWLPEEILPVAMPNWHYLHISDDVLPALKERGVTDEQITTMLVDNPRKIFSAQGGY